MLRDAKKNETDASEQVFPIWHCLVPVIVMPFWLFIVACLVLWAFPTRAHLRHYCLSQPAVWNRCSNICHCLDHLAMGGMPPLRVGRVQLCTVCSCIFRALSSPAQNICCHEIEKASAISTFSPVSCGKCKSPNNCYSTTTAHSVCMMILDKRVHTNQSVASHEID